jgi:hypothetical protein
MMLSWTADDSLAVCGAIAEKFPEIMMTW